MGELTTLSLANSDQKSLRSYVPIFIKEQFKLEKGDLLEWELMAGADGQLCIKIRPHKCVK